MRVFVLNTGRCGSLAFIKACGHIDNYTSGHESQLRLIGPDRIEYPDNHIEADNRLSWFTGRLEQRYGDTAFYVHLRRDPCEVARSFSRRYHRGIIFAYRHFILPGLPAHYSAHEVCMDYCDTVTHNIELFLRDKTRTMDVRISNAGEDFPRFWKAIGAQGNLKAAVEEFDVRHNSSAGQIGSSGAIGKCARKICRIARGCLGL